MNTLIGSTLLVMLTGADLPANALQAIGAQYPGTVQQAFQAHCADCHGQPPAELAEPARSMAQGKAKRAHRKLDMDNGFPFASKWPLAKLMAEIREAVEDNDMPPRKYMKKKGSTLSAEERAAIVEWARAAEGYLTKPAIPR